MNQKITLSDLADALAVKAHISKAGANSFIRDIFDTILAGLNDGESVKVRQLGTFKIAEVSARKGVDVNTGMPIEIAGRQRITFTPDKELAEAVNAPFAGFETVVIGDEDTPLRPKRLNRLPQPSSRHLRPKTHSPKLPCRPSCLPPPLHPSLRQSPSKNPRHRPQKQKCRNRPLYPSRNLLRPRSGLRGDGRRNDRRTCRSRAARE